MLKANMNMIMKQMMQEMRSTWGKRGKRKLQILRMLKKACILERQSKRIWRLL
jgi:hypothetical protein